MYYYRITASWPEAGDRISEIPGILSRNAPNAVLYKPDPIVLEIYVATQREQAIRLLQSEYNIEMLDDINYLVMTAFSANRN